MFRRRQAVDERHIFALDPFQIQREQIGAETVRHAVFKPRRCALFVWPQNPAATFFAHIPFGIGITQNRVFRVGLAVVHQRRIGFGDDILMFHHHRRRLDPKQLRRALGMVPRCRYHMLGGNLEHLVRRYKIAALFHHPGAGHDPFRPGPAIAIDLHFTLERRPVLARTLGHCLRHVGRVNIAVLRMIKRTHQILGAQQRPAIFHLARRQKLVIHPRRFRH